MPQGVEVCISSYSRLPRVLQWSSHPSPGGRPVPRQTAPRVRYPISCVPVALLFFYATHAAAFPQTLNDWQARYGGASASGDNAQCQLCHVEANGGDPWNGYGWNLRDSLADPGCDLNGDGAVSNQEAFFCVELLNSDADGSGFDDAMEIGLGTQPGWTDGPFNTWYNRNGTTDSNQPPPTRDIGKLDPDGTEPPPPPPPMPPDDDADLPPGQLNRRTIVVRPGDSIQAAIDRAQPGTRIYVLAGVYREPSNQTNGLNITKNGIRLIGQSGPGKRVIFENAGNQRNGIVVVPEDRVDCMGCHSDMAPPFPLRPGVESGGLKMREPMMHGFEIRSITIRGFDNNGLFTENVDGFKIIDVESVDNRNYGIFPTLSKNGLITHSRATGSDTDSGIWVETSENVLVTHNFVAENVNGIEVSNSDDILLAHNEATGTRSVRRSCSCRTSSTIATGRQADRHAPQLRPRQQQGQHRPARLHPRLRAEGDRRPVPGSGRFGDRGKPGREQRVLGDRHHRLLLRGLDQSVRLHWRGSHGDARVPGGSGGREQSRFREPGPGQRIGPAAPAAGVVRRGSDAPDTGAPRAGRPRQLLRGQRLHDVLRVVRLPGLRRRGRRRSGLGRRWTPRQHGQLRATCRIPTRRT